MTQPRRELDRGYEWYPKGSLPEDAMADLPAELAEVVTPDEVLCQEPHLGLATTLQLLEELASRGRVEDRYRTTGLELCNTANVLINRLPNSMLRYRTVGGQ